MISIEVSIITVLDISIFNQLNFLPHCSLPRVEITDGNDQLIEPGGGGGVCVTVHTFDRRGWRQGRLGMTMTLDTFVRCAAKETDGNERHSDIVDSGMTRRNFVHIKKSIDTWKAYQTRDWNCTWTDKKEKKIFLICKEIQMGSVTCIRKGLLIYEDWNLLVISDFATAPVWISLYMIKI